LGRELGIGVAGLCCAHTQKNFVSGSGFAVEKKGVAMYDELRK
jgi:hypothetical protein